MKCPVCDKRNDSMLCPNCGFDSSRDHGRYPTFGAVQRVPSAYGLRKAWKNQQRLAARGRLASKFSRKELKKHWLYGVGGAALLFAVLLGGLSNGGNEPGGIGESVLQTPVSTETLPVQLEFTDWLDALPEYVTPADYVIQDQTLYATHTLEKATSTQTDHLEGWTLVDTLTSTGEFGPFSEWSEQKAEATDTRNVETQPFYRYRSKETTTGDSPAKDGWELYDTTHSWSDYGAWSKWSETPAASDDARQTRTKTQYSYRDKLYTTSSDPELSGWIKYDTKSQWSDYGSWSDWTETAVSESDTVDVETRQVLVSEGKTTYTYGAYFSSNSSKPYSWTHFCGTCAAINYGGTWTYKTYTQSTRADASSLGQSCGHKGSFATQYKAADGYKYYYEEVNTTEPVYKTEYRYRTRSKLNTHYFYKWGAWSEYADTKVTGNADREVRTKTLYQFRDRKRIPTYHFLRWSDWSDWTADPISKNNSRVVESKPFYRYQDRITGTTYCFERWSELSGYTDVPAVETDEQKVYSRKQYRYRSKTAEEKRIPYTDVDADGPFSDAVAWITDQGIMNGASEDTFAPDKGITRGEMVMSLWRAAGKPVPETGECPFVDVSGDSVFLDAVLWATGKGITDGESPDRFGLHSTCTRGQVITFLYRALGEPDVILSQEPFSDVEQGAFYYEPVLWAYEHGISSGISTTEFGVDVGCTRVQAAVMIYRAFA